MLRTTLAVGSNEGWLKAATLIPVPPSKIEGDPLYDDRIFRVVFDDLLTTGAHFKAMKSALMERFAAAKITGVFLARRVPETDDPIEW